MYELLNDSPLIDADATETVYEAHQKGSETINRMQTEIRYQLVVSDLSPL